MEPQIQATESAANLAPRSKLDSLAGKFATDALLLGVLSAAGYCIAFAFESGYAKHFGYPTYLVSPTPSVIVTAVAATMFIVLGLAMPIVEALESANKSRRKGAVKIGFAFFFILMIGSVLIEGNFEIRAWITAGFLAAVMIGMNWASKKDAKEGNVVGPTGVSLSIVGLLLVVTYTLANLAGLVSAMNQQVFFFLPGKPDFAVVRVYDSTAIAVRYDFERRKFAGEYRVLKVGEDHGELKLERISLKDRRLPVLKDE